MYYVDCRSSLWSYTINVSIQIEEDFSQVYKIILSNFDRTFSYKAIFILYS